MARIGSREAEREALMQAARMMAAAARTAPKTRGVDAIQTVILDGEDLEVLAAAMEAKAPTKTAFGPTMLRDSKSVRKSAAVLLIGVTGDPKKPESPIDCGACGYANCAEFLRGQRQEGEDFRGPLCVFQAIDLGIALGSAARMAMEFNMDNRMMYTIGAAARSLGLLECDIIIGIPLSVAGKNIYFDR